MKRLILLLVCIWLCEPCLAQGGSSPGSPGMDEEGEPAFQRIVQQAKKHGLQSAQYAGALTELGLYYNRCARYRDAVRVLKQALQIVDSGALKPTPPFKEKPPLVQHHPGGVVSATNVNPPTPYEDLISNLLPALFSAETETANYKDAELHIKRLIQLRAPNDVAHKLNLMQAYSSYATLLRKLGRTAEAKRYEQMADEINKSFRPL